MTNGLMGSLESGSATAISWARSLSVPCPQVLQDPASKEVGHEYMHHLCLGLNPRIKISFFRAVPFCGILISHRSSTKTRRLRHVVGHWEPSQYVL